MFDLSFFELMVVGVVALVVIGPEKLPKVARMAGTLTGRAQRYMAQVKEEVNREGRFSDLQDLQDEIKAGIDKTQSELQHEVSDMQEAVKPSATKAKAPAKKRKPRSPRTYEDGLDDLGESKPAAKPKATVRKRRVRQPKPKADATSS